MNEHLKIKQRSDLRLKLGKIYYTTKRKLSWRFSLYRFAQIDQSHTTTHVVFEHKTPLYRKLKGVDMWLQENKVINLGIALQLLDDVVIKPDEVFSYWKCIGEPSYKKGYKDGMILGGGKFYAGVGGGLCQMSNLLFWLFIHSPLTVIERHRHSYDVFPDANRTQPFGSGATCAYNYLDLQVKNNTPYHFKLHIWLDETHLHGQILCDNALHERYEIYEDTHDITHEYWGAYIRHNTIKRKVFVGDEQKGDEFVCENTAIMMYEPLLESSKHKSK